MTSKVMPAKTIDSARPFPGRGGSQPPELGYEGPDGGSGSRPAGRPEIVPATLQPKRALEPAELA